MITCPNCGSSFSEGMKFCSKCGTKLPAVSEPAFTENDPVQEPAPAADPVIQADPIIRKPVKEKKEKKAASALKLKINPKLIAIAAAALALVILLIIFIPKIFAGGGSYALRKDYVQSGKLGEKWLSFNKAGKVTEMDAEASIVSNMVTADGTVNVFKDSDKNLYTVDAKGFNKIAEEVESYLVSFDGKTIAYMDEENALYLFTGGKDKKVAEDIYALSAISPDGKAVAYTKQSNENIRGYYYDGKEHELGKNMTPVALSAKGTYVYYTNQNGVLYVQKGENSDDRQKIVDGITNIFFNEDGTQVVANDGSKTYFSEKGGERTDVSKNGLRLLVPSRTMRSGTFYGISSLKDKLYYTYSSGEGYTVYKLSSKLELSSAIARNVMSLTLQEDGKYMSYLKNNKLYLMNVTEKEPEGKVLAIDVESYISSNDGKLFLYEDEEGETYSVNRNGKAQKVIGESVDEWAAVSNGFVYILDDEAYFTTGNKGSKITGFSDDVSDMSGYRDYVLLHCDDDTVFMLKDGKKPIKIWEED